MKKMIALVLCLVLLTTQAGACLASAEKSNEIINYINEDTQFDSFDDPALLQYIEDSIYTYLEGSFASDDYIIEDISAVYISQEYLEEVAYNTRENVYFGYTLSEINDAFEGKRYVFTYGGEGNTIVQEFEDFPDDTDARILKNVLIGTGVILVSVAITVISGGAASGASTAGAAKTISLIFAASAKTAVQHAASGMVLGAAASAITRGIESGDPYETIRAAGLGASEGFKWGAISGAVKGGTNEALRIREIRSTKIPSFRESEEHVAEAYSCTETQVSYLGGEKVSLTTAGATRPDGIRYIDGHWEAIEVKRYNLTAEANLSVLKKELKRQIGQRCVDLPDGMTQRIVLDVTGRGYTESFMESTVSMIQDYLYPIYPDIPIDVFGAVL